MGIKGLIDSSLYSSFISWISPAFSIPESWNLFRYKIHNECNKRLALDPSQDYALQLNINTQIQICRGVLYLVASLKQIILYSEQTATKNQSRTQCQGRCHKERIPAAEWYCMDCDLRFCTSCFLICHPFQSSHDAMTWQEYTETGMFGLHAGTVSKEARCGWSQVLRLQTQSNDQQHILRSEIQQLKQRVDRTNQNLKVYMHKLDRSSFQVHQLQQRNEALKKEVATLKKSLDTSAPREQTQLSAFASPPGFEQHYQVVWQWWKYVDGEFVPYSSEYQTVLERAFQLYLHSYTNPSSVIMQIDNTDYNIDFIALEQRDINSARNIRSVRRIIRSWLVPILGPVLNAPAETSVALVKELAAPEYTEIELDCNTDHDRWQMIQDMFYKQTDKQNDMKYIGGTIVRIRQVCNMRLQKRFETQRCLMGNETGETWLFHGTKKNPIDKVVAQGLDTRVSSYDAYLGQGIYGTQSMSYVHNSYVHIRPDKTHVVLLLQVLLGRCFVMQDSYQGLRRPPLDDDTGRMWDSTSLVVENSETTIYAVYDNSQVYPCYIIEYVIL